MRILMYTWEFPPLIAGGLGMACYGMVKALLKQNVEIDLIIPTREAVYFPMRTPEDADTLPVVFLDEKKQEEYYTTTFEDDNQRFKYIGITEAPETYKQVEEISESIRLAVEEQTDEDEEKIDREPGYEDIWDNIAHHLMGSDEIFKRVQEYTLRAERYAKILQYDAIHSHDWLCYPAGMIARKISGKPLVSHIHATEFDRAGGPGNPNVHNIEFTGMTYADYVIAVSQYTAEMIISRYRIDTGKIRIVHNAYIVDDNIQKCEKRLFHGTTILFLGRITLQKGPEFFLDVAKSVLEKHPDARFIMAGSGDMARKIIQRSAALKMRNRFLFTGFLNRKEVDDILKMSDIYMLPSISEPFGIAPLEAMAYGVTAVISKQSGVSEVVENAYKIDFWDVPRMVKVINDLIEHPAKRRKIGIAGMQEVNQIQWDDAATKIKAVYQEAIDEFQQQ